MPIIFSDFVCLDPMALGQSLAANDPPVPVNHWWGKVNRYETSLGLEPATASVLMTERSLKKLESERRIDRPHNLIFELDKKITIRNMYVKSWRRIYPAAEDADLSAVLVELVDVRQLLKRIPINKRYNLRDSDGVRIAATQNGGVDWTWAAMVEDIWNTVSGLGTFPGISFTPDGVPEGFVFDGMTAFEALSHVFQRLAVGVFYSPTDATWSTFQLGSSLTVASDVIRGWINSGLRIWDEFVGESTIAKLPASVRVCHWKLPVPSDGTSLVYTQDVAGSLASDQVQSGSVAILWDDLPAIYSGATLTNSAALGTRATERNNDYYRVAQQLTPKLQGFRGVDPLSRFALWGGSAIRMAIEDRGAGHRWEIYNSGNEEMKLEAWRPYRQFYSAAGGGACVGTVEFLKDICIQKDGDFITSISKTFNTINLCTGEVTNVRVEDPTLACATVDTACLRSYEDYWQAEMSSTDTLVPMRETLYLKMTLQSVTTFCYGTPTPVTLTAPCEITLPITFVPSVPAPFQYRENVWFGTITVGSLQLGVQLFCSPGIGSSPPTFDVVYQLYDPVGGTFRFSVFFGFSDIATNPSINPFVLDGTPTALNNSNGYDWCGTQYPAAPCDPAGFSVTSTARFQIQEMPF